MPKDDESARALSARAVGGRANAGAFLADLDDAWQRLEARLCAAVLVAELVSITLWVLLKGLSTDYLPGGNASGLVCRAAVAAALFCLVARVLTRGRPARTRRVAIALALALGMPMALLSVHLAWVHVAMGWSSNVLNWLQNASMLMLIGGLRGLATRLTLWLALLGASLATSRRKHVHVDVLARNVPPRFRALVAVAGWLAAAVACMVAALGFFDHISIAEFRASAVQPCPADPGRSCDAPFSEKLAVVARGVRTDFFLLGRQASLDARSLPRVLAGRPYDGWMTAAEWNAWLGSAAWKTHFDEAAVDALRMTPSDAAATRMPQVAVPGTGEDARGLLIRELNFVFPLGLAVIAAKLLLRVVIVLLDRSRGDPQSVPADDVGRAHGENDSPNEATARG